MKMKFGKKTMFIVVLIFLGILLFMYFRNSGREGLTTHDQKRRADTKEKCLKIKDAKWTAHQYRNGGSCT